MTSRDSDMIKEWRHDRGSFRRNEDTLTMYKTKFPRFCFTIERFIY